MKNNIQDDIFDFSEQEQEPTQQTTDTLDNMFNDEGADLDDFNDTLSVQNRFDRIKERQALAHRNKRKTVLLAIGALLCVLIMIGTLISFVSSSISFRTQKSNLEQLTQKYEDEQNQIDTMTEQSKQLDQSITDLTAEIAKISG